MRVAVTGASGRLGTAVVAVLSHAGYEVRGVDLVPMAAPGALEHVVADVTRFGDAVAALEGCAVLVHAGSHPRPTGRLASEVFTDNASGVFNVVEACTTLGIEKVVYASSFSVIGPPFNHTEFRPAALPLDESAPVAPQDAYALSKLVGEEVLDAATRRSSLSATSLRMPWLQGPETFTSEVAARRCERKFSARNLWSYLDVRDAAEAFLLAIEHPTTGHQRLFLSAADTFADRPTEEVVREAFGDGVLARALPDCAAVIDTTRARQLLGFVPRHSWREYPA